MRVGVGQQVWNRLRVAGSVIRIVGLATEVLHDVPVLGGDGHWVVRVDGVRLEVVREGPHRELVEHTSLIDVKVIADLIVSPVREVTRVVIDLDILIAILVGMLG